MDLTALAAYSGLGVALIASAGTLFGKKIKGPEDKAVARRDTIADRDAWIKTLNERIDKLDARLETAEGEIEEVRDHNNSLINYCHRLIAIVRRHGHDDEIPMPPPSGVHL